MFSSNNKMLKQIYIGHQINIESLKPHHFKKFLDAAEEFCPLVFNDNLPVFTFTHTSILIEHSSSSPILQDNSNIFPQNKDYAHANNDSSTFNITTHTLIQVNSNSHTPVAGPSHTYHKLHSTAAFS